MVSKVRGGETERDGKRGKDEKKKTKRNTPHPRQRRPLPYHPSPIAHHPSPSVRAPDPRSGGTHRACCIAIAILPPYLFGSIVAAPHALPASAEDGPWAAEMNCVGGGQSGGQE